MYGHDEIAGTPSLSAVFGASVSQPLTGDAAARAAVLRCFSDPLPAQCACLGSLSVREWKRLLQWLDMSGLALYFLDRVNELEKTQWLPPAILARLQQNAADNTERIRELIADAREIEGEFQRSAVSYAVLKGFSLWPNSVSRLELRAQCDLDYLVAEKDAEEARRVLEAKGYHRYAVSGRTWEFKAGDLPSGKITDLYKARAFRCVELHIEPSESGASSLLARREIREFFGMQMPVLSAVDLFLWQGMHVFKHFCQDMARASHLLEFRRHVLARRDDAEFWRRLQSIAADSPRTYLGLGVVTRLIEVTFGSFAPQDLRCWSADRLPKPVRLYVDTHGYRIQLAGFPGNKLYLLLQRELEIAGVSPSRPLREQLIPLRLPPRSEHVPGPESLPRRVRRARARLGFLAFRFRFHVVAGIHYAWKALLWRKQRNAGA
jgi:hypothetical protein